MFASYLIGFKRDGHNGQMKYSSRADAKILMKLSIILMEYEAKGADVLILSKYQ